MKQGFIDQLVGSRIAAIGVWAPGVAEGASRSRGSVVLATDNGLSLRARGQEFVVVTDRAAPRRGISSTIVGAAHILIDALAGGGRALDLVLETPNPFTADSQARRYILTEEGYGEYAVFAVPLPVSLQPRASWPVRPRAVRLMDYEQDWLWKASAVVPILSPLSGEARLGVAGPSGAEALFYDEGCLYVGDFDAELHSSAIAGIGGKEIWDYSVDETDTQIVLELSDATQQFSVLIAEYRSGGIEVYQCVRVEIPH